MDDLIEKLADLPWGEAHNRLMGMKLPTDLRISLSDKVNDLRKKRSKARRRAKLTQAHHTEAWYRLLAPLKYELSNARVGLKLKSFDAAPERHVAFSEYVLLLEKLLAGLQKMQMDEGTKARAATFEAYANDTASTADYARTPTELAVERGLPNKGEHWADWVSDKTRTRIEMLFDAIPTRAKRPRPFERRIPPKQYGKDVEALQRRTLKDIGMVDQELGMLKKVEYCTKEQIDRMAKLTEERKRMVFALYHVTVSKQDTAPVPVTWHGLVHKYYAEDAVEEHERREYRDWIVEHLQKHFALQPRPEKKKTNRPKRYRK